MQGRAQKCLARSPPVCRFISDAIVDADRIGLPESLKALRG
jgi:hypothetical protein